MIYFLDQIDCCQNRITRCFQTQKKVAEQFQIITLKSIKKSQKIPCCELVKKYPGIVLIGSTKRVIPFCNSLRQEYSIFLLVSLHNVVNTRIIIFS